MDTPHYTCRVYVEFFMSRWLVRKVAGQRPGLLGKLETRPTSTQNAHRRLSDALANRALAHELRGDPLEMPQPDPLILGFSIFYLSYYFGLSLYLPLFGVMGAGRKRVVKEVVAARPGAPRIPGSGTYRDGGGLVRRGGSLASASSPERQPRGAVRPRSTWIRRASKAAQSRVDT